MSDLSIYASKFSLNSKSLNNFDESISYFRKKDRQIETQETEKNAVEKLLSVLHPIAAIIQGKLSISMIINESNIVDTLKEWHSSDWPSYSEAILDLYTRLSGNTFELNNKDFQLLNDIADALEAECQKLFRRMRRI